MCRSRQPTFAAGFPQDGKFKPGTASHMAAQSVDHRRFARRTGIVIPQRRDTLSYAFAAAIIVAAMAALYSYLSDAGAAVGGR